MPLEKEIAMDISSAEMREIVVAVEVSPKDSEHEAMKVAKEYIEKKFEYCNVDNLVLIYASETMLLWRYTR
jgi:hypothetical protein